jgi:hypothetical protein
MMGCSLKFGMNQSLMFCTLTLKMEKLHSS